ncbi:MAG: hypothetical protein WCV58_02195 [Patescibacteria group bacterium]
MKKMLYGADLDRKTINRAMRLVEKHLWLYRTNRAQNLPEEARVRLYLDLQKLFRGELPAPDQLIWRFKNAFGRLYQKVEDLLAA